VVHCIQVEADGNFHKLDRDPDYVSYAVWVPVAALFAFLAVRNHSLRHCLCPRALCRLFLCWFCGHMRNSVECSGGAVDFVAIGDGLSRGPRLQRTPHSSRSNQHAKAFMRRERVFKLLGTYSDARTTKTESDGGLSGPDVDETALQSKGETCGAEKK